MGWRENFEFPTQEQGRAAHKADHDALGRYLDSIGVMQGIAGNGVVDDQPVLQAHLDEFHCLFLPPKPMRLAQPIRITSHQFQAIRGTGMLSMLKPDPDVAAIVIDVQNTNLQYPVFEDFMIFGGAKGIHAVPSQWQINGLQIRGVRVRDYTDTGIDFQNSAYNSVLECVNCHGGGVGAQYGIVLSGPYGINGNTLIQCNCDLNEQAGIYLDARQQNNCEAVNVVGGIFQSNGIGIQVFGTNRSGIQHAYFEGNSSFDIELEGDANDGIWDFTVDGCYYVHTGGPNIHVVGKATGLEFRSFVGSGGIQWNDNQPLYTSGRRTITQVERVVVDANGAPV